ncbi:sialidase [Haloferax sp. AS1]|nr:sialidase [Haloferax sp. AS1]
MRKVAGVLLALLILLPSATPVVAQTSNSGQVVGKPDIDISPSTNEFEPGTTAELRLAITNRGQIDKGGPAEYEDRVTTARGLTIDVRDAAPIEVNTGTVAVGNVPTGTESVDPISITVSDDAEPGTYRIPVEYTYAYTRIAEYETYGVEYHDFTEQDNQYITIRIRDQARFEVVNRSSTAQVGSKGTFTVTLENTGTSAANAASVTATSRSDELTLGSGSKQSTAQVGSWSPGERRTLNYTVSMADDATLREYSVDMVVDYTDVNGIDRSSRTVNVGVNPRGEQSFALENVSTNLRIGREGTLRGTIVNEGPDPITNPVVRFAADNPNIHVDSSEYAISDLAPSERATFEYTVSVSDAASASIQQFNLTVKYRNQQGDVRYSDGLETNAEIQPQQDRFTVSVVNSTIQAGGERSLTVRVRNNGDENLTNVEAKAFVQDPLSSDNDEGIIPQLEPGESDEFTIALSTAGDTLPKRYPVSFDFQYEMPDGDTEITRTYKVPIEVMPSEGGGLPIEMLLGGVALVGVVATVWWRRSQQD